MSDRVFIDTNILVYLHASDNKQKHEIVKKILIDHDIVIISTQVVNEFINVMHKKMKADLNTIDQDVKDFPKFFSVVNISLDTIENAIAITRQHHYRYFDSLMIAAALQNQCHTLYTEDMHSGHRIANRLQIKNPFL